MLYNCPNCGRDGMEWDARAKVMMCYYNSCSHVIRIKGQTSIPAEKEILQAIENDTEIDVTTPDKADLQQFTPGQIEEYCESMQRCYRKGQGKHIGVQIIRQLQTTTQAELSQPRAGSGAL